MRKKRHNCTPEEKVIILKRHLVSLKKGDNAAPCKPPNANSLNVRFQLRRN